MREGVARTDEPPWQGIVLGLLLGVGGCTIPTRITGVNPEIARQTTPTVIDEGLRKLDEAETKRRIERMMASPEMKAVMQELIAGLVDGSLSTLSDEERSARIAELTSHTLQKVTRSAVDGVLDGAMSEEHQRALRRLAGSLMAASIEQVKQSLDDAKLGTSVSAVLSEQVAPAVEKALKENFAPGLAAVLTDEKVSRALGATARVMGREMILGANEALSEIQDKGTSPESASLFSRLSNLTRKGTQLVSTLTWAIGAVTVALAIWVARLLVQRKRFSTESEKRAEKTRLLAEAIRASEGKPWSDELIQALEERFRSEEEAVIELRRARRKLARGPKKAHRTEQSDDTEPRSSLT